MENEILINIQKMHSNVIKDQKSNILSLVSYDILKPKLKKLGFKFSNFQFLTARNKRESNIFTLNNYKRFVPYSKKKLVETDKQNIIKYLYDNSYESSHSNIGIRFLDKSKKMIYKQYINNQDNKKISYNTFLKYCPKNFKYSNRRTDVCGICEIGNKMKMKGTRGLNFEEKQNYIRNMKILEKHIKVVENQRSQFNLIKNNLNSDSCILILDFKENFKLSSSGHELSYDFYNKRQVSCLGASLIFKSNGIENIQYAAYLSDILNHDSLFSGDVLELIIKEIKSQFKYINIFTDCGPHFRSNEFLCRIKNLSQVYNINISINFFGEYHGKSLVDGFFGKLSKIFKKLDFENNIKNAKNLKELFEKEALKNNYLKNFFRIYQRKSRNKFIKKLKI